MCTSTITSIQQDIFNQFHTQGYAIGYEYTYMNALAKQYLAKRRIKRLKPKKFLDLATKNTGVVLISGDKLPPGFGVVYRNNNQPQVIRYAKLTQNNDAGDTDDQVKPTPFRSTQSQD